jgi:hypothetical protein
MIQLMCKCTIGRFQYHNSVIEFSEQQRLAHKEAQGELPRKKWAFDLFFGCVQTQNVSVVCIYLYIYILWLAPLQITTCTNQNDKCGNALCTLFDCLNSRPTVLVGWFGSTFEPFFNHVCIYRHIYRHSWGLGLQY